MSDFGLHVRHDTGGKRIAIECQHQSGVLYVVPSESSWVCSDDLLHAHALAGFFRQLNELGEPKVRHVMQQWGIYFRPRAIESEDQTEGG